MDSLCRLRDFGSSTRGVSLLHMLIALVGHPKLADKPDRSEVQLLRRLEDELPDLAYGSGEDFVDVRRQVDGMQAEVAFLETEKEQLEKYQLEDQGPLKVVRETLDLATKSASRVKLQAADYEQISSRLLELFGERQCEGAAKDKASENLIQHLHQFMVMFRKGWDDIGKEPNKFSALKGTGGHLPIELLDVKPLVTKLEVAFPDLELEDDTPVTKEQEVKEGRRKGTPSSTVFSRVAKLFSFR